MWQIYVIEYYLAIEKNSGHLPENGCRFGQHVRKSKADSEKYHMLSVTCQFRPSNENRREVDN